MKHILQRAGVGFGLLATSLGAMASGGQIGLHTYGDTMIYAKESAGTYAAFMPSGNATTDYVVLVEFTQGSGTVAGTWNYFLSEAMPNTAGIVGKFAGAAGSISNTYWLITNSSSQDTTTFSSSWYSGIGNGSTSHPLAIQTSDGEIAISFSYTSALSSQTCSISFNAYVGPNDYLQYQVYGYAASGGLAVSNLPTSTNPNDSSNSYVATTKSGGASTDTITGANFATDFMGGGTYTGVSLSVIPTYSFFEVSVSTQPTFTVGSAAWKAVNACSTQANTRLALNNSGLIIGGKQGLVRIW